jgi:hypothetical protein
MRTIGKTLKDKGKVILEEYAKEKLKQQFKMALKKKTFSSPQNNSLPMSITKQSLLPMTVVPTTENKRSLPVDIVKISTPHTPISTPVGSAVTTTPKKANAERGAMLIRFANLNDVSKELFTNKTH